MKKYLLVRYRSFEDGEIAFGTLPFETKLSDVYKALQDKDYPVEKILNITKIEL